MWDRNFQEQKQMSGTDGMEKRKDFSEICMCCKKEVRLVLFFSLSLGFVLIFEFYLVNCCGLLLVD